MQLDLLFFAVAVPAVLIAGISKGGLGSGVSFVAAPLLTLVVDPSFALGVLLPLLLVIDAATLRPYWRKWSGPDTVLLAAGAVPGILIGVVFWRIAPEDAIRALIGFVALSFVVWRLFWRGGRTGTRDLPRWIGLGTGAAAGFTSFVSHAGGPPVAMYLLGKGIDKTTYQATTVIVFAIINVVKVAPYAALGLFTSQTLLVGTVLVPVALLGAYIGVRAHRWISETVFFAVTYVLLAGAGLKLLWDALT